MIKTVNKKAREEEIFCCLVLDKCVFVKENLIVGDELNLPDIFSADHSFGIEVVMSEKEIDHKQNSLWKKIIENKFDSEKCSLLKQEMREVNLEEEEDEEREENKKSSPFVLLVNDGKVGGVTSNEKAHSIDWLKLENEKRICGKLEKLNKGNYSKITGNMSLCVLSRNRYMGEFDFKLLVYQYLNLSAGFVKKYDKIYFITSQTVFCWTYEDNLKITPIMYGDVIYDFDFEGDFHFQRIEYNYDELHREALTLVPLEKE